MEFYTNNFKVVFTNRTAAERAKHIAVETLNSLSFDMYSYNPAKRYADSLRLEENTLTSDELCFDSSDFQEAATATIKAIAAGLKTENFTFDVCGCDTYTEGWVDGSLENGILTIISTYYPMGYCEYLECPECGEEIVRIEDFDPSKTYRCPECGEIVDLSQCYADVAPVIEKELITIC